MTFRHLFGSRELFHQHYAFRDHHLSWFTVTTTFRGLISPVTFRHVFGGLSCFWRSRVAVVNLFTSTAHFVTTAFRGWIYPLSWIHASSIRAIPNHIFCKCFCKFVHFRYYSYLFPFDTIRGNLRFVPFRYYSNLFTFDAIRGKMLFCEFVPFWNYSNLHFRYYSW